VTAAPSGDFVVVWDSFGQGGIFQNVFGQRYGLTGSPLGSEFRANSSTAALRPAAATDAAGNLVIAWNGADSGSGLIGVFGRRFAADGAPLAPDFRINTYTTNDQFDPTIGIDASGNFVVAWQSNAQDGSFYGVYAQRFAASGDAMGPEFRVNTFTFNGQFVSAVAADPAGNFLVVWESGQDGSNGGVYGQRFGQMVPVELMRFGVE
jgi:hypothetical protein